jgi:cyclic pyranopterin phosphate synthase
MFDRFEREITYLRISVTDKCNLRCRYCMPAEGVPRRAHSDFLSFEQIVQVARAAVGLGVRKIRLTGGEPLVKRGIVDLVRLLSRDAEPEHLAMTTNGTLLPQYAHPLREAGLHSVNVSLDTLDAERYRWLTRGADIRQALDGIDAALEAGFPVKINVVMLRDTPESDIGDMRGFCERVGARLQLINHFELGREKQEEHCFDRPPSCDTCNRIRLMADGMLKPCLHSDREVALDLSRIGESLIEAVRAKPARGGACTNRAMPQIGG